MHTPPPILRLQYNHLTSSIHTHTTNPLSSTPPHNLARTTSNFSCLLSSPPTAPHSHNRPRNKFPSPFPGHPHQITPFLPYPYPFHLHPFSEQAITGENGGKRVNRTSPETLVSRVCISVLVFSCFIHPRLTTCRAHEEGENKEKKTHPQVVLNCSKTAINPSSLPFSCLNVILVPCPLSPVPLMDEYVDLGDAGGFGEFPPLVGTA